MSNFYNQASWVLVPSGIEEDIVFAQKPISGLGDLNFQRASDATYTDSTGVVRRSPYNLVQQSEMFSDVVWTKDNISITPNTTNAPNGTLTADTLTGNGTSSSKFIYTSNNLISGRSYTISIYAKKNTNNFIQIGGTTLVFGLNSWANFDLNNGVLGSIGSSATASIQDAGNGWYRCSVTASAITTGNAAVILYALISSSTSTLVQSNTLSTSVFIWGAQLVEGTAALDYFPTTNRQDVPRIDFRNADGTLSSCGRLLLEPQRTNSIRNSSMVGAVAGTPGTGPTNWSLGAAGLTRSISGVGIENGLPYVDIRFQGVASGTSLISYFDNTTAIAASTGQTWSLSTYCKFTSNPNPPVSTSLWQVEWTSGGISVVAVNTQTITPSANLQRFSYTRTLAGGATTASIQPGIQFALVVGQSYDFTIRIAAPQMELGAYATTWVPTTTTAVTRIGDAFTRNNIYTNGFISSAGGTWFVDFTNNFLYSLTNEIVSAGLEIGDSAGNSPNAFKFRRGGGTQRISLWKRVSSVDTILYSPTVDVAKYAIKWNGTTADVFFNGVKIISATSFTATNMQFLKYIVDQFPMYMNQSFLAPTPLSDAQCIQLTTL